MSQEAYELLLEANDLFSQNKKDEAITAYREVLQLDPSPNQRLVAEDQLRTLGDLPHSFATSGNVSHRKAGIPTRSKRMHKPRKKRNGPTKEGHRRKNGRDTSKSSSTNVPQKDTSVEWSHKSSRKLSTARTGHVISMMDSMCVASEERPEQAAANGALQSSFSHRSNGSKRVLRNASKSNSASKEPSSSQAVAEVSSASLEVPKQRSYESLESFQTRIERYQIWLQQREVYPGIDINTAVRLDETGWTLEELRAVQQERRSRYLSRKKTFSKARQEQNRTYSGTHHMETWQEEAVPLWGLSHNSLEWFGRLRSNRLYEWEVEDKSNTTHTYHKLALGCVCEEELVSDVWELCRFDKAQALRGETPAERPQDRLIIPDELLHNSLVHEQPVAVQLMCGLWFWGWVFWYDPYQLSVVLNIDAEDDEDLIEVMLFRHSIKSISSEKPAEWNDLPIYKGSGVRGPKSGV